MFIYQIGLISYDDNGYTLLCSDTKYTKKELEDTIVEVALPICMELEKTLPMSRYLTWEDVHEKVISALCAEKGFALWEPQESITLYGWSALSNRPSSFTDPTNPLLDRIRSEIKKRKEQTKNVQP